MQLDHGTFALYERAAPSIPARPERPTVGAIPAPPEWPGQDATPEQAASYAEAIAAFEAARAAVHATYAAATAQWETDLAAWSTATSADRRVADMIAAGALFARNGSGVDWYDIAHLPPTPGRTFAVVKGDEVVSVSHDPSTLWPIDARVIETDDMSVAAGWRLVSGVLTSPADIQPTPSDLRARAAAKRWAVETGGCLDPSARPIATDRDSQAKLIAEMVAIGAGMRTDPSPWKLADGSFSSLTNVEMLAVIAAARAHIAAAFAAEAVVLAAIDAGTITTLAAVDGWAWPPNT